jgi:predicted nucleotidyltransferase
MARERASHRAARTSESAVAGGTPDGEALARVVRRIVETVQPQQIVLFGSAARGEMSADSDVDLLVVVRDGVHPRRTAQLLYRRGLDAPFPVDLVVATTGMLDRYRESPGMVYREALRDGRLLYAA